MLSRYRAALLLMFLSFLAVACNAATLETKDGDVIHCDVRSIDATHVTVTSKLLGEIRFVLKDVASISWEAHSKKPRPSESSTAMREFVTSLPDEAVVSAMKSMVKRNAISSAASILSQLPARRASACLAMMKDPVIVAEIANAYAAKKAMK